MVSDLFRGQVKVDGNGGDARLEPGQISQHCLGAVVREDPNALALGQTRGQQSVGGPIKQFIEARPIELDSFVSERKSLSGGPHQIWGD